MFAPIELPDDAQALEAAAQELAREILTSLMHLSTPLHVAAGADLSQEIGDARYAFVAEGLAKALLGDKLVRYYDRDEFILALGSPAPTGLRFVSETGCRLLLFDKTATLELLRGRPALLLQWLALNELHQRMMLLLAGTALPEETPPSMKLVRYAEGDLIVREGSEPNEVYAMLEGEAKVLLGGVEVGRIGPNEIFGELAFFAESQRTATVQAVRTSLVHVADQAGFAKLIQAQPEFAINICRTMAQRIIGLNERLRGGQ